ncbi:MAG: hypothetical protein IT581_20390 [Verrucomicrobiales bacterium]|nr:hypothetical protein [Verrucomicrobiales bacterium]
MGLLSTFSELLVTPFVHRGSLNGELIWGIVPLYAGWIANELNSSRASYKTAFNTGCSFVWAGCHWSYLLYHGGGSGLGRTNHVVSLAVTALVLALGALAIFSAWRRRFPKAGRFLGHSRFANYFTIAIYPMQSAFLAWTWTRLAAVAVFALPVWILAHFALMPWRKR